MTRRAAIYARYSAENQREASIDDQIEICRRYAERMGWDIIEVYSDAAVSCASAFRPGLSRLQADARGRRFDVVLCEALDRLGRNSVRPDLAESCQADFGTSRKVSRPSLLHAGRQLPGREQRLTTGTICGKRSCGNHRGRLGAGQPARSAPGGLMRTMSCPVRKMARTRLPPCDHTASVAA
jgi:hypothetical protein